MAKGKKGAEINLKEDSRKDLTGVGTPEVGAPTVEEMKAAGKSQGKGVERDEKPAPGSADGPRSTVELDCEGMTGYRQSDSVLGSEGNTK